MSRVLRFKTNRQYGVHVVTTEDVNKGQVVVAAEPFASIEYLQCNSNGCFTCGKSIKSVIQCNNCFDLRFCSYFCKSQKIHRQKCDEKFDHTDDPTVRLASQIMIVAINAVDDISVLFDFYRSILSKNKQSNTCSSILARYGEMLRLKQVEDDTNAPTARKVVKVIGRLPKVQAFAEKNPIDFCRMLFILACRHVGSIPLNGFSETVEYSDGGACMRYYIFDALSRLNHSCDPNLEQYLEEDDVTYCAASRHIKAGEQLFICYFGEEQFANTRERKKYLKETWNFTCKCQKCQKCLNN